MTDESVEAMVYVIEGDIVLVSRSVLEMLGCIPNHLLVSCLQSIPIQQDGCLMGHIMVSSHLPDNNTDNSDEVKIVNEAEAIKPQAYNYKPWSSQWSDNKRANVTLKVSYHAHVQEEISWTLLRSCPCPPRTATGKHCKSSSRSTTSRVRSIHVRDSTGQSHLDPQ